MSGFVKNEGGARLSSILLAVGALLGVGVVFLLLPLAGGLQEKPSPDATVREVELLRLPAPPEEEQPAAEEVQAEAVSAPQPQWSRQAEAVALAPLAVEGSGPPMPASLTGDLALVEFPLAHGPAAMPEVFAINEVDTRPVALAQKPPVYPWELRRSRVEGEAVMTFTIDAEGRVGEIRVESATHESFGQASAEAIRQWRYKPAEMNGKPVACMVRMTLPFNLR